MEIKESKVKWIAGLSNGETIIEGEGIASKVEGELSPWWKLQEYLKENNLTINSFYLACGGQHFNLPSVNPKFNGEKPLGYNCFRMVQTDSLVGDNSKDELYICAEAIYKNYKVQLWVDEKDTRKCWVNVINLGKNGNGTGI